jgi:L-lysine 6-transaminase
LETIEDERLLQNARERGAELQQGLEQLSGRFPHLLRNARGRGLMCALDLPTPEQRSALIKRAFAERLLLLPCGAKTVRFRPFLNVQSEHLHELLARLERALAKI